MELERFGRKLLWFRLPACRASVSCNSSSSLTSTSFLDTGITSTPRLYSACLSVSRQPIYKTLWEAEEHRTDRLSVNNLKREEFTERYQGSRQGTRERGCGTGSSPLETGHRAGTAAAVQRRSLADWIALPHRSTSVTSTRRRGRSCAGPWRATTRSAPIAYRHVIVGSFSSLSLAGGPGRPYDLTYGFATISYALRLSYSA